MKYGALCERKGVAGLNVLLSLIAMLFMIGIIVMVFTIAGSKLQDSVSTTATSGSVSQTLLNLTTSATLTTCSGASDGSISTITLVNATGGETILASGNYTTSGCVVVGDGSSPYLNTNVNATYTYTYESDPESVEVINETKVSIKDVTDWFPTFIVLGAMVVLILLVVIIINSIKSSGITQGA